jgi:hypothetical protein
MPHNEFVQNFIKIIGPFYEYVDDNGNLVNDDEQSHENEEDEEKIEEKELNNNVKYKSYAKNEINGKLNGSIPIKNPNNNINPINLYSNGFSTSNGHTMSFKNEACSGIF